MATLVAWNMRGEIWQGRGRFGGKRAIFMQRAECPIWLNSFRGELTAWAIRGAIRAWLLPRPAAQRAHEHTIFL